MSQLSVPIALLLGLGSAALLSTHSAVEKPWIPKKPVQPKKEHYEPPTPKCPDRDGDGHPDQACGGGDCDDGDPRVHPGAAEVCDSANRDEDCDHRTFGTSDTDGDGYHDKKCCNRRRSDREWFCGNDCDDSDAGIHPNQNEVCNGKDDDCDEAVDEKLEMSMYEDKDGDLFGDPGTETKGCPHKLGNRVTNGLDCDDTNARKNNILGCGPGKKKKRRKKRRRKKKGKKKAKK